MNKWKRWFAWYPVRSIHAYGNAYPTMWLCEVLRRRTNSGKWEYTHYESTYILDENGDVIDTWKKIMEGNHPR